MEYMRKQFEDYILRSEPQDRAYPILERSRSDGDGYLDLYVQLKWQGWKARTEVN